MCIICFLFSSTGGHLCDQRTSFRARIAAENIDPVKSPAFLKLRGHRFRSFSGACFWTGCNSTLVVVLVRFMIVRTCQQFSFFSGLFPLSLGGSPPRRAYSFKKKIPLSLKARLDAQNYSDIHRFSLLVRHRFSY